MFYNVATRKRSLKPNNASLFRTLVEMQSSTPDPLAQSLWWGSVFWVSHVLQVTVMHSRSEKQSCPTLNHAPCSVAHLCQTLCDPMDGSLPGCSVHRILQARILEWVAIPFSRVFSWPREWTLIFCINRRILYHWATWEALEKLCLQVNPTH